MTETHDAARGPEGLYDLLDRRAAGARSEVNSARAYALGAEEVGQVLEAAERATECLASGRVSELVEGARVVYTRGREPHPWLAFRGASLLQAAFRFTGEAAVLDEAIEACTRCGDHIRTPRLAVAARALLGSVYLMSGRLHAAYERCDAAIALAKEKDLERSASAALAYQFRGYVLWEWSRVSDAEAHLMRAWDLTSPTDRGIRSGVARVLAMLTASLGRFEESTEWLGELEAMVREPQSQRNREWMAAVRLTLGVLASRAPRTPAARGFAGIREIDAWVSAWSYRPDEINDWSVEDVRAKLHELDHVLTLLELTGQWDLACQTADVVLASVGEHRMGFRLRAATVRAVALERLGRKGEAVEAWGAALQLGANEGYARTFVDGSPARATLTRVALRDPAIEPIARRLAEAAPAWLGGAANVVITARQAEVLQLLAEGHSNKAIARELGIAVSTVKTHVRSLLLTLEAESRSHAVAAARRLGLV